MNKPKKLVTIAACLLAAAPAAFAQTTNIDILFAYTKEAGDRVGGPKGIRTQIDKGLALLNEALKNNATNVAVTALPDLVEVTGVPIPSTEAAVGELLKSFTDLNGDFAQVHKLRKTHKGSIAVLIYSGYAMGKANLSTAPAEGNLTKAGMVTQYSTFDASYVFAHEFGHVLGCAHFGETGMFPYSSGFTMTAGGKKFRTIENNGAVSAPYFSQNTTATVNGQKVAIGDATHDCAKDIKEVAPAFSKFGGTLPAITGAGKYAAKLVTIPAAAVPPSAPSKKITITITDKGAGEVTNPSGEALYLALDLLEKGSSVGRVLALVQPGAKVNPSHEMFKGDVLEVWMVPPGTPQKEDPKSVPGAVKLDSRTY